MRWPLRPSRETAVAIGSGGGYPHGRLRISASLLFSQMAMGGLAASYAARYPEVAVEVMGEDRLVDMVEGYDLAIRVNPPADESLIVCAFLHDPLVAVAIPALAREGRAGAVPVVVRHDNPSAHWDIKAEAGSRPMPVRPVLRWSSVPMVLDAVRSGIGAGLLPISLVSRDLRDGRLVQLGDAADPPVTLWALYPPDGVQRARLVLHRPSRGDFPCRDARGLGGLYRPPGCRRTCRVADRARALRSRCRRPGALLSSSRRLSGGRGVTAPESATRGSSNLGTPRRSDQLGATD